MRFGLYSQPAQTETLPAPLAIEESPEPQSESAFEVFHESLCQLQRLRLHDYRAQTKRNSELVKSLSNHAAEQASSSIQALQNQLEKDLDYLDSEYKQYLNMLKRKAEEEERERQRLRKLEEEKKRALEEEKRIAAQKAEKARKEAEEAKRKAEEDERKRLADAKAAQAKADLEEKKLLEQEKAKKERKGMTSQARIQQSLLTQHENIKSIKETIVGALDQDKPLKKEMGIIKRKINVKLGQLSSSKQQANSVFEGICSLVNSVPPNSLQYHWLLNFIAKALVSQAETEVTVKPSAAVPLAYIAASLLSSHTDFDYYLSARLVKKCCFVIGFTGSIDSENGRLRMGWKRSGDNKWETEVKYEERVAGILTVWAVMTRFIDSPNHPLFNWDAQWTFLARILNTNQDLLQDVHYVVVSNWWEAAAEGFYKKYGEQAVKLLTLATQGWAAIGVSKKFGAANRLQVLGEDVQKSEFNSLKNMDY